MTIFEYINRMDEQKLAKYLSSLSSVCDLCSEDEKEQCDERCEEHILSFLKSEMDMTGFTLREVLALEHPNMISEDAKGGCIGCPKNYGYVQKHECGYSDSVKNVEECEKCWNSPFLGKKI